MEVSGQISLGLKGLFLIIYVELTGLQLVLASLPVSVAAFFAVSASSLSLAISSRAVFINMASALSTAFLAVNSCSLACH